jgi:class 3 adenylate cyclase
VRSSVLCLLLLFSYKVETIGDAYLACAGVVSRNATQTADLVRFALDLQTSTRFMHTPEGLPLVIRIGIHTGSVVAGVVGRKMPRYHLFGETGSFA